MNSLIYLAAGAIVGLIASRVMQIYSWQGLLIDIIVGMVGAFLAGQLLSPLLGGGTMNDTVTIPTMLVTLTGSILMLWIVEAVHR